MIGVDVSVAERPAVAEFFELFKTPWEFSVPGRNYEVQICTSQQPDCTRAKLTIIYLKTGFSGSSIAPPAEFCELQYHDRMFPVYCGQKDFGSRSLSFLSHRLSGQAAVHAERTAAGTIISVGYALFDEVHYLLTFGQPLRFSRIPTLEYHISVLRELIARAGFAVVEIPPKPAGYTFIACLTHDVDHPLQRRHVFDHTMVGFLFRATLGSLLNTIRGRLSLRNLGRNLSAAAQVPLTLAGLARDTWSEFDKYLHLEDGLGATYFIIPRATYAGRRREGVAPKNRASRYGAQDIKPQLHRIAAGGCEIGTHGLDAWIDSHEGRQEREAVKSATNSDPRGVRMHWLYFDQQSPETLEAAGFTYDSTFGYNQSVGFRAGTVQAFKPLGAKTLMELPLHVMDTALFYPSYLNLTRSAALSLVRELIHVAVENAGVLTFNWHDRSLFPERLWGDVYREIIAELKLQHAWFPTASNAVQWFQNRRGASLAVLTEERGVVISGRASASRDLPSLVIHVTSPVSRTADEALAGSRPQAPREYPFAEHCEVSFN